MEASVSEIHRYPLRPDGFEEPLFPTMESRRAVLDHLLLSSWLSRASELEGRGGEAVHAGRETVDVKSRSGRVRISWASGRRRGRRERRIVEVLGCWRGGRGGGGEGRGAGRGLFRGVLS